MIERAKQFLNELSAMSDAEVSKYYLGSGSTREAYAFGDYIIKIPRFVIRFNDRSDYTEQQILKIIKRGVKQTNKEIKIFKRCKDKHRYLLNPVVAHSRIFNMPFVVMPKIRIASSKVPFEVQNVKAFIEWLDLCVPKTYHDDVYEFSVDNKLYLSDLEENLDNFGLDGSGRLLLADYGT